jgi:hypothetical protein
MVVLPFVISVPAAIQPKFCGIRKFIIKNTAIGISEIMWQSAHVVHSASAIPMKEFVKTARAAFRPPSRTVMSPRSESEIVGLQRQ